MKYENKMADLDNDHFVLLIVVVASGRCQSDESDDQDHNENRCSDDDAFHVWRQS